VLIVIDVVNIDHFYYDEHSKETIFVVLAKHKIAP